MKKYAFFLPQFHEIKENNEWWGKGFTEWTNVKRAKPLYKKHIQPNIPLNQNYYCLLDKKTVEWQTNLMKKYKIDGFIYYHYYFNGKLLLEKPAENILHWKDINQNYFFCWANHTWNRSWNGSTEVLIEQEYGSEIEWNNHFNYLIQFFKDNRYEKVDNKPVFMIFNSNFKEKKLMFEFFNKKCIEYGFDGIYLIETYKGSKWPKGLIEFENNVSSVTEKIFFRESSSSMNIYNTQNDNIRIKAINKLKYELRKRNFITKPKIYDGNKLFDTMMREEPFNDKFIHGLFFEWDNTPRHGSRGFIITPPSKEKVFLLMDKCKFDKFIFINAWNEWAEGMILEPNEKNKYKYLEWMKEWNDKNDGNN